MSIYLGDSEPSKIYVGSDEVSEVYVGDTKVRPTGPDKDYLCFTANTAGSTVKLQKNGSPTSVTLEKSTNGSSWSSYTIGDTITLSNIGDKVYFRNTSTTDTGFNTSGSYYKFVMTGSINGSGDVNFLLNKNSTTTVSSYCFRYLFSGCSSLATAPTLPATTLASNCYEYMFSSCSALTTAPSLPATSLAEYCYQYMFSSCSSLTTAPSLPATSLASYCYIYMFYYCSALTTAPSLPATSLASYCYSNMFTQSGITTAPALPATSLADGCYSYMFYGCKKLTTVQQISATSMTGRPCENMFNGCTALISLPKLYAASITRYAYNGMFRGCSKIKLSATQTGEYQTPYRIPPTGTGSTAYGGLANMFTSTGGTFTGEPSINTTYYTSNTVV